MIHVGFLSLFPHPQLKLKISQTFYSANRKGQITFTFAAPFTIKILNYYFEGRSFFLFFEEGKTYLDFSAYCSIRKKAEEGENWSLSIQVMILISSLGNTRFGSDVKELHDWNRENNWTKQLKLTQ